MPKRHVHQNKSGSPDRNSFNRVTTVMGKTMRIADRIDSKYPQGKRICLLPECDKEVPLFTRTYRTFRKESYAGKGYCSKYHSHKHEAILKGKIFTWRGVRIKH